MLRKLAMARCGNGRGTRDLGFGIRDLRATHGTLAGNPPPELAEVQLRVGVRGNDRAAVERFTKEIAPLILTGPPGVTGFAGGRPKVEEIVAYWPALIPKNEIEAKVELIDV